MNNNLTVCKGKEWKTAKFKVGDFVDHEGEKSVITRVVVYPNVDYIFAYNVWPTHRGSDIPEDELEFVDGY